MIKIPTFFTKHEPYFSFLWNISLCAGMLWGFVKWIEALFLNAQHGSVIGFMLALAMQTVLVVIYGILTSLVVFPIVVTLTIIPYLIMRGLIK